MNIKESVILNDEKPSVLTIKNTEKSNVIAIGLKKNQVLKKHITPIPALLVVLQGSILFDLDGQVTPLSVLNSFEIPVNTLHEVRAEEDSIFLVIKEK